MKKNLDNNWVSIKEEFEIAGVVFPKNATGICTFEGNKGFLVLFDYFKTDNHSSDKCWATFSNEYKQYFKVLEELDKPWYELDASRGKGNNKM